MASVIFESRGMGSPPKHENPRRFRAVLLTASLKAASSAPREKGEKEKKKETKVRQSGHDHEWHPWMLLSPSPEILQQMSIPAQLGVAAGD